MAKQSLVQVNSKFTEISAAYLLRVRCGKDKLVNGFTLVASKFFKIEY
jgi:hypothetical protein